MGHALADRNRWGDDITLFADTADRNRPPQLTTANFGNDATDSDFEADGQCGWTTWPCFEPRTHPAEFTADIGLKAGTAP